ncbi:hypothetical protein KTU01_25540 [Kocuria turfanensis]|uniref:Uncharacterized protein n=2 Tax=Kocuria turfanensis TaxID=388357 RepID=A0A512IFE9_9MICC|nr:hypothetical protein KTU01_25540 [Kocuria turfanensis]
MTTRRLVHGLLVAMCLGTVLVLVDLVVSWPPDLPWGIVQYVLAALWITALVWMIVSFRRQGQRGN